MKIINKYKYKQIDIASCFTQVVSYRNLIYKILENIKKENEDGDNTVDG